MAKFKEGDIVTVKSNLVVGKEYNKTCLFAPWMEDMMGKKVLITSVFNISSGNSRYRISDWGCSLCDDMIVEDEYCVELL